MPPRCRGVAPDAPAAVAARVPWLGEAIAWLKVLVWWAMPAYLLVMQKRVYRQGWPMTVLAWCVIALLGTALCLACVRGWGRFKSN